jgi:4-hydroxybenzoate polyprenyltransferase
MTRWIAYQRERFPLLAHGPLVAAFSVSAVSFSRLVRGEPGFPPAAPLVVAFATALIFFLQLRIADEFKDFEDDARYRPYRPVPRGLVTLRELGWVGVGGAAVQLALALWLHPPLVALLVIAWAYLALMSREFFAAAWLREHPAVYMASHMVIIPLIDLYATACDWLPVRRWPPDGLIWFLLVSYANGIVVEIGRKTRAPADEETGVETYSSAWGLPTAVGVWLAALVVTALIAWQAARQIGFAVPVAGLLVVLIGLAALASLRLLRRRAAGDGKALEIAAGVWTLLMYLSLGAIPALLASRGAP